MCNVYVLVAADIEGKFSKIFSRVSEIQRKNNDRFVYLFAVGCFFGDDGEEWNDVLSGKIKVPIATYILGPTKKEHLKYFSTKSEELAPNVIYLGKKGIFTGSSGLKIAYLSGFEMKESNDISFSKQDVSELVSNCEDCSIDVLLTTQWPAGVTKFTKTPELLMNKPDIGSRSISYLAGKLKPKYHFSASSEVFYERVPYRNNKVLQEQATHVTRFISVAAVTNEKKLKWIYAFKIIPFTKQDKKVAIDSSNVATECPYDIDENKSQFFYDMDSTSRNQKRPKKESHEYTPENKKKRNMEVSREKCWFCLSNPEVEQQLILSIATHSYLTIAKGGIVQDHLLILPIKHIRSSVELPIEVDKEISQYKCALVDYYNSQDKDVVFFERSLASPHLQIQVVPIPKSKTQNVKATIFEIADANGLEFVELSEFSLLKQVVHDKKSFFYVEIEKNKKSVGKLIHIITKKFPLQFGRLVLASESVLNLPHCIDWKSCKLTNAEEEKIVQSFRQSFKPYDFSLN